MAKVDNKASNTQIMQMHNLKKKHGVVGKIDEVDLGCTDIIYYNGCKCLNVADPNKLPSVIRPNPNDAYLTSDPDVDGQIMIKLQFRDPVSLTRITVRATKGPTADDIKQAFGDEDDEDDDDDHTPAGPRLIKLFANKPELDFTDAEDMKPSQQIALKPKQLKGDKQLQLKALKFQRCTSLQIFFVDNQKQSEFTFVNRIGLTGRLAKGYHTEYGK